MPKKPSVRKGIKRPTSILFREVDLNLGGLFKALPKAAISYQLGKWDDAISASVDAAKSLFMLKKRTPDEQAYFLIRRALVEAIGSLIRSATALSSIQWSEVCDDTIKLLDSSVDAAKLTVTQSFFKEPQHFALLDVIETQLGVWFRESGFSESQSTEVAACLPEHFVVALRNEWQRNHADYGKLNIYSPSFAKVEERERFWSNYRTWLLLQADPPLFDETFSLSSVYVDLRSYWEKPASQKGVKEPIAQQSTVQRIVGYLKDQIDAWLEAASALDSVRVISGGPGSGKSVFAKRLAAEQSKLRKWQIVYVPLHQFAIKGALRDGLAEFCANHPMLPDDVFNPKSAEKYLVIFDGLDELSKQGQIGEELAREFFTQVQVLTSQMNIADSSSARLLVLLCGRPVAVSSTRADELCVGQVVHVLPYFISDSQMSGNDVIWIDQERLLKTDQRNEWWTRYGEATGESLKEIPPELHTDNLESVTSEPLLNYLVSLSRKGGLKWTPFFGPPG